MSMATFFYVFPPILNFSIHSYIMPRPSLYIVVTGIFKVTIFSL
jgi:hypothetical protein